MATKKKPLRKAELGVNVNSDPNRYVQNKNNIFGKNKFKEISKQKFDRVSNRYSKQKGSEELGSSTSPAQQVISGRNPSNSVSRENSSAVKKEEETLIKKEPTMKKGGAVKKNLVKKSVKSKKK